MLCGGGGVQQTVRRALGAARRGSAGPGGRAAGRARCQGSVHAKPSAFRTLDPLDDSVGYSGQALPIYEGWQGAKLVRPQTSTRGVSIATPEGWQPWAYVRKRPGGAAPTQVGGERARLSSRPWGPSRGLGTQRSAGLQPPWQPIHAHPATLRCARAPRWDHGGCLFGLVGLGRGEEEDRRRLGALATSRRCTPWPGGWGARDNGMRTLDKRPLRAPNPDQSALSSIACVQPSKGVQPRWLRSGSSATQAAQAVLWRDSAPLSNARVGKGGPTRHGITARGEEQARARRGARPRAQARACAQRSRPWEGQSPRVFVVFAQASRSAPGLCLRTRSANGQACKSACFFGF